MKTDLSCPYCNAVVPPPPGVRAGQQITCPRCDEPFKVLGEREPASEPPPARSAKPQADLPQADLPHADLHRSVSNRSLAGVVLGVMGFMAAAGLALALVTQSVRRANDSGLKREGDGFPFADLPEMPPLPAVAPANLAALRYLPPDTNVLLALHAAEVYQDDNARKLLRTSLPGLGNVEESLLKWIKKLTGLGLPDLDHVVLGARVNARDGLPRVQIVVRTRFAYDGAKLRDRHHLNADPHDAARNRPIYRFNKPLGNLPLADGLLACPDDRTFILGWQVEDLSDMPDRPREGSGHLPAEILTLLKERMKPSGPVWLAAHSDNWARALALLLLLYPPEREERALLPHLRSFAVWLELDERATLRATARCANLAAARQVEKYLRERFKDRDGLKLPPPRDEWLTVQYRP